MGQTLVRSGVRHCMFEQYPLIGFIPAQILRLLNHYTIVCDVSPSFVTSHILS